MDANSDPLIEALARQKSEPPLMPTVVGCARTALCRWSSTLPRAPAFPYRVYGRNLAALTGEKLSAPIAFQRVPPTDAGSGIDATYIRGRMSGFPNARAVLEERRANGALTWAGPATMLFARSILAVIAASLVAALMALNGSATPWRDAALWFPVYATLIDIGCLTLLRALMRREGGRLVDLLSFERARLGRDVLFALVLTAPSLVFILGGVAAASLIVYGSTEPPMLFKPLPFPAALYATLVFPLIWGFTEQMTYNGYLAPRIQVLTGSTAIAVALVAFSWSFQHVAMPVKFDPAYVAYRMLSPIPFSIFIVLVYLRVRRLMPLAIAHWLMDGASVVAGSLLSLLLPVGGKA